MKCSVNGCPKKAHARTWCRMHYRRWAIDGDPGEAAARTRLGQRRCATNDGYVRVWAPDHPQATAQGYALEHRVVVHDAGIPLRPQDHGHHRNGIKHDNRLENLEVLTPEQHAQEHGEERRRLDPERAATLYRSGLSTVQVAEIMGTFPGNVSRLIRAAGVEARPQPKKRPDIDRDAVAERLRNREVPSQIAADLGCSVGFIEAIRNEYRIPLLRQRVLS